ncbi:MAG: hypothetical protein RIR79_1412 [Pseudomonadota bacterium]|jgi:uncharacterized protein YdcH (DUF465 family)
MEKETFDLFPPAMQQAFIALMRSHERLDDQIKQTSMRVDETTASMKLLMERSNRFDERIAQTTANIERISRNIEKTHQDIDKVYKAQGRAENNRGAEVEEFFYNTLMHEPVIGTMQFDKVLSNHMVGKKGKETELDLLLINGNSLAVIEVKSKFHPKDLGQLQEHIDFLRDHSPEFKNYRFYGGIAGFSIPNDVTKAAHDKGYFVLKRRGKIITVNTQGMMAQ